MSESLFEDSALIANVCKPGWEHLDQIRNWMMDEDELKAWKALPHSVTIYRGCSKLNERGWSWTICEDVATRFAERYVLDYERYVVSATVNRVEMYGLFLSRNESEVMIHPNSIRHTYRVRTFRKEPSQSKFIFNMVQHGKAPWQSPQGELEMFKLLVATNPADPREIRAFIEDRYAAYEFFGFKTKAELMKAKLDYMTSIGK